MDIKNPFISAYDVVDVKCMMKMSYQVVVWEHYNEIINWKVNA